MEEKDKQILSLLQENERLKNELLDANNIIEAIRSGEIDALIVHKNGRSEIYSIESADYTYRILIEKFSEGALSMTYNGIILYCNDSFGKILNLPTDRITGTSLTDYLDHFHNLQALMGDLKKGTVKREINLRMENAIIPVTISFTDLHPHVEGIGVVVTDLTEKKQHERALLAYQQQLETKVHELNSTNVSLSQFIHVISHDLKEPVRKILMYTSRLAESTKLTEANPIKVIKSSAMRLNSLVDDLVKYAFNSTRHQAIEVDLNTVLSEVMDDLELIITERAAQIEFKDLPVISATEVQMGQLFSNLISNSIKYCKEGVVPHIKISHHLERDGDMLYDRIAVSDNGIGMDNAHLDKIFTIFQRLHLRNEYSGNGIGLAICKKIMENHNGHISVESTPEEGSTFNLYFPARSI
tara:strand:+ start:2374 stop:3612 length:1239 start_codon:yes stop_codon:yes gene_type:complete